MIELQHLLPSPGVPLDEIWALEAAALNPEVREFKTGVLQT